MKFQRKEILTTRILQAYQAVQKIIKFNLELLIRVSEDNQLQQVIVELVSFPKTHTQKK